MLPPASGFFKSPVFCKMRRTDERAIPNSLAVARMFPACLLKTADTSSTLRRSALGTFMFFLGVVKGLAMQTDSKNKAYNANNNVTFARLGLYVFDLGIFCDDCLLAGLVIRSVSLFLVFELLIVVRSNLRFRSDRGFQICIVLRQDRNLYESVN